ncbi:MAG: endo,4-beta-xylanase [Nocardioidaceae bacterium]|jgi:endo-1,4-beta-xylanase|nr:endo,4-beta-xylanase [Nocardioidaceae bacterium]
MTIDLDLSRRGLLVGTGAAAVLGTTAGLAPSADAVPVGTPALKTPPLWRAAGKRGILYGSSTATWQISDPDYAKVFRRHAEILFTEDDLLWYRLKPTPDSPLDFTYSDQIIEFAESNGQLVFGAHLVWDEGFGDGWTDDDLWGLNEKQARRLLFGTLRAVMSRYRGRVPIWSVVNEAIVNGTDKGHRGLRTDVPWINTIGPEYVAHAFREAHDTEPDACLVLNDFGYETVNQYGDRPIDKMHATLQVLDRLLGDGVPVHAFGIQAHLLADRFHERFHARRYRHFLNELGNRGLKVLITELDVLDDGLPKAAGRRDKLIGDIYRRYLDVALDSPDVAAVMSFGLSDRYTWLQEDYPRGDGAARRPLAFSSSLKAKPAYNAIHRQLARAPRRWPTWRGPRHVTTTRPVR